LRRLLLRFPASFAVDIELDRNHGEPFMTTLTTATVSVQAVSVPTVPLQALSVQTVPLQALSIFSKPHNFWVENREASLNWLALGLLLAAWNAADGGDDPNARRPDSLRGYSSVSVRAVQHSVGQIDHVR
jgi:hypothetical protein